MRSRMMLAGLTLTVAASLALPARAEDGYRHGRMRLVEPGVSLQRANGVGAEEADTNEPFLPGDRVWTNAAGRAEFQFPDGSLVRLDQRSKLDYAGHDERDGNRIVLRLWSGSLYLRVRARDSRFEIETPAGTVRGLERSLARVDVDAGEARVSVYEGEALFDDTRTSLRLAAGQRAYARSGERIADLEDFDLGEEDAFSRWNGDLDAQNRWEGRSAQYLPEELDTYAAEFDGYGDWRYETTVGYVWVPRVEVDWHPYWQGRWCWTAFGWTWVPYETWGWAPSHYGRWGYASFGWYWIPGRVWSPAWVSWAAGDGYVGWCPLGWRDRPVRDWDSQRHARQERGHAVPRGGRGVERTDAWNVVPQGDLGQRNLAQRRVATERLNNVALQVAASARVRPTRDARSLVEGAATLRSLSTRPMPGDFVPELAADNKTLRTPWFRGGGGSPSSVGAQVREGGGRSVGSTVGSTVGGTVGNTASATRRGSEPASMGAASRKESDTSRPRTTWSNTSAGGDSRGSEPRSIPRSESGGRSLGTPMVAPPLVHEGTQSPSRGGQAEHGTSSAPAARSFGGSRETPRSDTSPSRPRDMSSDSGSHSSGESAAPRTQGGASSSGGSQGGASSSGRSHGGQTSSGGSQGERSMGSASGGSSSGSSQQSEGARERHRR